VFVRIRRIAFSSVCALLVASAAIAQQAAPFTVIEVHRQKAAPGKTAQYEAGRKKHMDWHRQAGDPWTWTIWSVTTGPDTGSYIVTSGDHQWADFDTWLAKYGAGDQADVAINTAPHVASTETSYWRTRPEISLMPASNDLPPMGTLTTFYVKPGMATQFRETIAKLNGALKKANWPLAGIWYELVNGGEPAFAVFTPRKGMADLQPPEPSMQARVAQQLGQAEADALWKSLSEAYSHSLSEILERRDDLGYRPAK
jgi:hypothetical protein